MILRLRLRHRLSLPAFFAIVGAVAFLIGAAGMGYIHQSLSLAQMKQMAEENNVALAATLSNVLLPNIERLLAAADSLDPVALEDHAEVAHIETAIHAAVVGTNIVKVKIYGPNGRTLFSSDRRQIGGDGSNNAGFRAAMSGEVASDLLYRDQFDAFEGIIVDRDLLYSYLPIRAARSGGEAIGVFEIYVDVTEFKAHIRYTLLLVLIAICAAFAVLYGLLVMTVMVGSRRIHDEHRKNLRLARNVARAEAASQAKSDFLAHMSHELRTPLNAVLGFSEVIREETMGPVTPQCYRDYARNIHSAGQHLLRIVNSVLDLVSIESGKVGLELQEIHPVDDVLVPVAAMLKAQSDKAGVKLGLDVPRTMPSIVTDAEKLKRIVLNLAANGIKFTPVGGDVTLGAGSDTANGSLTIQVRDNGIGMAPEDIPLCLTAFGRVDSPFEGRYEGTGLGLHLSQQMANELGGELTIDSAPGQGTTVTVTLPDQRSCEIAA